MRPKDIAFTDCLDKRLEKFHTNIRALPGIQDKNSRMVLLEQFAESQHRVDYFSAVEKRTISALRADPSSTLFDPLLAALLHKKQNNIEEAFWLAFLAIHFGKPLGTGWLRVRDVYGGLEEGTRWTWDNVRCDVRAFKAWLAKNHERIRGRFGNHRKYTSLNAVSATGTGAAVETYVDWVAERGTHAELIADAIGKAGGNRRTAFDSLYTSLGSIASFGRMAKFDFLTMLAKLGLAPIEPGSIYAQGSTGPLFGARLLFGGCKDYSLSAAELDPLLTDLADSIEVNMQVLEDALCNWQKSPMQVIRFRG